MTDRGSVSFGAQGARVSDVQRRLLRLGFTDVTVDGVFGAVTEQSVRQFQRQRGMAADGVVDAETWRALVEAGWSLGDRLLIRTRRPLRGDDVLELQHRLNQLGFDAGPEDGIFGALTQAAVEEFQRNTGLAVDGRAGPTTISVLRRLRRDHQSEGLGIRARERESMRRLSRRGLAGTRLLIDPACGDADRGAVGPNGAEESFVTWAIASRVAARLNAAGATTFLSRGPVTTPAGSERARLANELDVEAVVSIGTNALATPTAQGATSYYFGSHRFTSEAGRRLAELVQDAVVAAGWRPDCRVHPMTWAILRETRMPAVVVEPGFLTSPHDERRLSDPLGQDGLAAAITSGVSRFFTAALKAAIAV